MSRQDKATTERHTKTLRETLKKPENKVCADCKRNDPRWASWNLGVYLCIRCSGIHRGMGTHISKVKSVDLDVWTPEQMESVLKWGNYRANLYWEAHLKAGHVPPEHKMESFVRSKYESRRWALEGPPPSDPSVLEEGATSNATPAPAPTQQQASSAPTHVSNSSISSRRAASPVVQSTHSARQPQTHQLLSTAVASQTRNNVPANTTATVAAQSPIQQQQKALSEDLFSLDFHAPPVNSFSSTNHASSSQQSQQPKDVKQDILSLFSTPPSRAPVQAQQGASAFGQLGVAQQLQASSPWGVQSSQPQQQAPLATSMIGSNGTGAWGASSGWSAPVVPPAQGNVWGNPTALPTQQSSAGLFGTSDVWGSTTSTSGGGDSFNTPFASAPKKDDAFGDLWGDFK